MSTERLCKNCDYWDADQTSCHRNAPDSANKFYFPNISETGWCGDFSPKGTYDKLVEVTEFIEAEAAKIMEEAPTENLDGLTFLTDPIEV